MGIAISVTENFGKIVQIGDRELLCTLLLSLNVNGSARLTISPDLRLIVNDKGTANSTTLFAKLVSQKSARSDRAAVHLPVDLTMHPVTNDTYTRKGLGKGAALRSYSKLRPRRD